MGINVYLRRFIFVIVGTLIYSIAVNMFLIPFKLLSGGVAGIAMIFQYLTNISSGYFIVLINIPLFLLAVKKVDKDFGLFSFIGMLLTSIFLILTRNLCFVHLVRNMLISCIIGGALTGLGLGLVFNQKASEGGTDIISVIVNKNFKIDIGKMSFAMNIIVVALGAYTGSIITALYTLLSMFVQAIIIDNVIKMKLAKAPAVLFLAKR